MTHFDAIYTKTEKRKLHHMASIQFWTVIFSLLLLFLTAFPVGAEADMTYFLKIPGIKGITTDATWAGWIKATSFYYTLPELPAAKDLTTFPPNKTRGMSSATELEKPWCSFVKPEDSTDILLIKAANNPKPFPQWEIKICRVTGEAVLTFLFKRVVVTKITTREGKQYITFQFEQVIWNLH